MQDGRGLMAVKEKEGWGVSNMVQVLYMLPHSLRTRGCCLNWVLYGEFCSIMQIRRHSFCKVLENDHNEYNDCNMAL